MSESIEGIVFTATEDHFGQCPKCFQPLWPGQRVVFTGTDSDLTHERCPRR